MQKKINTKVGLDLNNDWYRELYEFSPLMYFIIDSEGYVLSVNKKGAASGCGQALSFRAASERLSQIGQLYETL